MKERTRERTNERTNSSKPRYLSGLHKKLKPLDEGTIRRNELIQPKTSSTSTSISSSHLFTISTNQATVQPPRTKLSKRSKQTNTGSNLTTIGGATKSIQYVKIRNTNTGCFAACTGTAARGNTGRILLCATGANKSIGAYVYSGDLAAMDNTTRVRTPNGVVRAESRYGSRPGGLGRFLLRRRRR